MSLILKRQLKPKLHGVNGFYIKKSCIFDTLPSLSTKINWFFFSFKNDQFNVSCLHFSGFFQDSPCQYLYQGGVRGEESQDWNTSRW